MRALLLLLAVGPSWGYESQCVLPGLVPGGLVTQAAEEIICKKPEPPECKHGVEAAQKGRFLGEHTLITAHAMELAGLSYFVEKEALAHYYSAGDATVAVAAPGSMKKKVSRPVKIPEFSQLPDWSWGLSDYLLGNEHCFVHNSTLLGSGVPDSKDGVRKCHEYFPTLGMFNSMHFVPQSQHIYRHYHGLALRAAHDCKLLKDRAEGLTGPNGEKPFKDPQLIDHLKQVVLPDCELKAMTLQSVASHYLADAWSTGHMWERWGTPVFDSLTSWTSVGIVAASGGLIHGARALLKEHDPMCEPTPAVEWLDVDGQQHRGGGDTYLLRCTADGRPPISLDPALSLQYRRMIDCLGDGFLAVYDAGPQTLGRVYGYGLGTGVGSSLDPLCWNQRATNKAMLAGIGTSIPLTLNVVGQTVTTFSYGKELRRLRHRFERNTERNPLGNENATLSRGRTRTFLGVARNSDHVNLVAAATRQYADGATPGLRGSVCQADSGCAEGEYCDAGSCRAHTDAIEFGFLRGSMFRNCGLSDDELERQRLACQASGGEACEACIDLVRPIVNNGCGPTPRLYPDRGGAVWPPDNYADPKPYSWCVETHSTSRLNIRWDPADPTGRDAAAGTYCRGKREIKEYRLNFNYPSDVNPGASMETHEALPSSTWFDMCGTGGARALDIGIEIRPSQDHFHDITIAPEDYGDQAGRTHRTNLRDFEIKECAGGGHVVFTQTGNVFRVATHHWGFLAGLTGKICIKPLRPDVFGRFRMTVSAPIH